MKYKRFSRVADSDEEVPSASSNNQKLLKSKKRKKCQCLVCKNFNVLCAKISTGYHRKRVSSYRMYCCCLETGKTHVILPQVISRTSYGIWVELPSLQVL